MNRDHLVRPRWVWSGVALVLLGGCGIALWVATWWRAAGIAGAVLLVLGGIAVLRGGIFYDTHGGGPVKGEVKDTRKGNVHRGTAPGDMITDERLRQEARETSRMTAAVLRAADDSPRPPFDKLGAGLLLAGAAFLLPAQAMYPHTHTGQDNALRTLLLGAVTALAALRILLGQRPGPAPSALAGLAGLALILLGVFTDHDRVGTVIVEISVGSWIVLAALLSLDHARPSSAARPALSGAERPVLEHTGRPQAVRARAGEPAWPDNVRLAGVALVIGTAVFWSAHAARRLAHRS